MKAQNYNNWDDCAHWMGLGNLIRNIFMQWKSFHVAQITLQQEILFLFLGQMKTVSTGKEISSYREAHHDFQDLNALCEVRFNFFFVTAWRAVSGAEKSHLIVRVSLSCLLFPGQTKAVASENVSKNNLFTKTHNYEN